MDKEQVQLINLVFDYTLKVTESNSKLDRAKNRIWNHFEQAGYIINNPIGEPYSETRTDCEAHISGEQLKNLVISEVLKPIIYQKDESGQLALRQQGVVIVTSK